MDIKTIRRNNLIRLIKQFKSIRDFADNADMDASHVSQIKNSYSNMGDKIARMLEVHFKKSHGWMDKDNEISEEPGVYLATATDKPITQTIDDKRLQKAINYLFESIPLDEIKQNGGEWASETIMFIFDLLSDPATENLKPDTIRKIIK